MGNASAWRDFYTEWMEKAVQKQWEAEHEAIMRESSGWTFTPKGIFSRAETLPDNTTYARTFTAAALDGLYDRYGIVPCPRQRRNKLLLL